jgi:hypothetical protein
MTEEEDIIFRQKFARWLDEWELEQQLRLDEIPLETAQESHEIITNKPEHEDVKSGDILLLSEELTNKKTSYLKPIFIAVLREWEKDDDGEIFLWAPFSPFPVPATDHEIILEGNEERFSVLSLWNAHTSPKAVLAKSWLVGKLNTENRKNALDVFWYSLGMKVLTSEVESKVGAKLFNSKDPRRNYIDEELSKTSLIRELSIGTTADITATSTDDENIIQFPPPEIFEGKLAAADDYIESIYHEYLCVELPIKVSLQYIPRHKQILIELHTEDETLQRELDMFKIKLIDNNEPNLSFENGQCVHAISLNSINFVLMSPAGKVLRLSQIRYS